ncbi:MAG: TetR/AcrR family transcriptional regulator, partial [Eubacterium sp.]
MAIASSDKGIRTKNKIIQIAKSEFYNKGFAKTSIKKICEQVDIRTGTFAYYFKTKDDLLKEIYSDLHMRTYLFIN